ncbi:MAG: hypothetical protein E7H57_12180 [Pantoea sp.]|nr:hypothetical protein [Pantoea sp.]
MTKFIASLLLACSFTSTAGCWTVEGMHGSTYAERDKYAREDDGFSGKFTILVNGKTAAVLYDGVDAGGMIYQPLSDHVVIGLSTVPDKHAMETWVIQNDGKVLMTKTISGFNGFDSAKAMVGKVTGSCN